MVSPQWNEQSVAATFDYTKTHPLLFIYLFIYSFYRGHKKYPFSRISKYNPDLASKPSSVRV